MQDGFQKLSEPELKEIFINITRNSSSKALYEGISRCQLFEMILHMAVKWSEFSS